MKIYLHRQGISLVGKHWEIQRKLKEYGEYYQTVSDWIHNEKKKSHGKSSTIIPFPKNNR
ncbi:Z-ring formation inhibitor MciZ [Bacillus salitolerans]|uniref:Z-ring formation inhibitor MciZ n=1 Tax=Bacillus salitolerans TaxID=1437434 RepID=A0ABW4LUE8_9BACI